MCTIACRSFILAALLLAGLFPSTANAAPGDELVIIDTIVNLREQPSTDAKILLKLAQDRRLIEIRREGEWVEVYTDRDDIGAGWVHASLLALLPDYNTAVINHTEPFRQFMEAFTRLNASWEQQFGDPLFTGIDEYINHRIKITATSKWLQTDQKQREQMLTTLFDLWGKTVAPGQSIEITIMTPDGTPTMSMFR